MARADLLLDLVRAGARGDRPLFRKSLEAFVSEERAKRRPVLADRRPRTGRRQGDPKMRAPAFQRLYTERAYRPKMIAMTGTATSAGARRRCRIT